MSAFRRFWTDALAVPHEGGWAIALDGKTALTPARAALATRHQRLAEAVAAEWRDAAETLKPETMPLTGYLNAVIDRVRANQAALAVEVERFARHELVCYRAEGPPELVRRQNKEWDAVLTWLRGRHGASLHVATGLIPIEQPAEALARIQGLVHALDAYRLTAALKLSGITKSLVLTLAALEGWLTPQEAHASSRIDETFQAEHWGEDAEAARRVAKEQAEVAFVARFLDLLD